MAETRPNPHLNDPSIQATGLRAARAQIKAARLRERELIASGQLTANQFEPSPLLDRTLAGFTLIREIHRGGQGVVYEALQQTTNRRVAIKVLLDGAHASKSARQRFEREIELVAGLRHPNVISVFHSDQTSDGLRYCVMDFVRGRPLTRHVREAGPTLEETLLLFAKVCDAVNHAHQKGVIHRDLKPNNILVDAEGDPKVLDFGLAKIVGGQAESFVSVAGQFVGTLPYMSPEQVRGNPEEIDTRSDVYSLGVMLYEMLTGRHPYPVMGPMAEVLGHIGGTEPAPPSRHGWQGASGRRSEALDDEIDTIVLKSLAKDRERRYQSAGELGRDIRHYLAGEPIEAKRDSAVYLFRKQLRRHRVAVVVILGFLGLLAAGLVTAGTLWRQAVQARDAESDQRARAEAINVFLRDMLTAADPANAKGARLTVRESLDAAAKKIEEGAVRNQPRIEAEIRFTIGSTYLAIGLFPEAEIHLRAADALQTRVLGPEHPDTLRTRTKLAETLWYKSDYMGVADLTGSILEAQRRILGEDDPDTLKSMVLLGRVIWLKPGRYFESESLLRSTIDRLERVRGHDHPDTAAALDGLGETYLFNGYRNKAEPLHREALRINTLTLGEEHPATLYSMFHLANTLDPRSAEPLYRKNYELRLRVLGPDHVDTLASQHSIAHAISHQHRYAEAEPLFRESLAALLRIAPHYVNTIVVYHQLGWCLEQQQKYSEAEVMVRQALDEARKQFGPEDSDTTVRIMCTLAELLAKVNKDAEAEQVAREVFAIQHRQTPRPPPEEFTQSSIALVKVLRRRGADPEAMQVERELIDFWLAEAQAPDADATTLDGAAAMLNAAAWNMLTAVPEAYRAPEAALELSLRSNDLGRNENPMHLDTLALAYFQLGDAANAVKWQKAALELLPPDAAWRAECEARFAEYEKALERGAEESGNP